jgi:hypothetical protein
MNVENYNKKRKGSQENMQKGEKGADELKVQEGVEEANKKNDVKTVI